MAGRRAPSAAVRGFTACADTESATDRAPGAQAEQTASLLRTINDAGGELQRQAPEAGLSDRAGQAGALGNELVPEERGRRRTLQDHISCRAFGPVKLQALRNPHRTKKTRFFCRTGLKERASLERTLFRNTIQPFDLMSRRHPLFVDQSLQTFIQGSNDVPASSRRQFSEKRSYFFFFATLRVFFAVFFTALFAFFAFFAFLAMLPS